MPNWCDNKLTITGPDSEIQRFIKESTGIGPVYKESQWYLVGKSQEEIKASKEGKARHEREREPDVLNFHSLVPIPEETLNAGFSHIYEKDADGNNKPKVDAPECGYDAQCRLWGTKWGACDVAVTTPADTQCSPVTEYDSDTWISYNFDTAWSPPEPWVRAVSPMFPFCIFNLVYKEEGNGYRGQLMLKKGEVLLDETSQIAFQDYVAEEGEEYAWDCYDLHDTLEEINKDAEVFISKKEVTDA